MSPKYLQPAMVNQAVHSLPVTLVIFIMNSHLEKWQDFSADFGTQPFHSCRGQHLIEFGVWLPVFLSVTNTMTSSAKSIYFAWEPRTLTLFVFFLILPRSRGRSPRQSQQITMTVCSYVVRFPFHQNRQCQFCIAPIRKRMFCMQASHQGSHGPMNTQSGFGHHLTKVDLVTRRHFNVTQVVHGELSLFQKLPLSDKWSGRHKLYIPVSVTGWRVGTPQPRLQTALGDGLLICIML